MIKFNNTSREQNIRRPYADTTTQRISVKRWSDLTTNIDIFRTANILTREHGSTAAIHAAMRADELLDQGDLDGWAVWPPG